MTEHPLGSELASAARSIRDSQTGTRITYSPKVFIPLTKLCQDRCGYCTFAEPPARVESPYLELADVLKIARKGARAGCHEALFTLGERPELRYPSARAWLDDHGYESTVHYVRTAAELVLTETGLLPHANAGALFADELKLLREVSPSQGMMIESLRADLECHTGSPDKEPARRLATLEAAGELAIPFTTGILVGIGEDRSDRIAALEAIAASHARHGHVQEVIVQNFLQKSGTRMHRDPSCPTDTHLDAISLARVILPPDVHVQAPPNLTEDVASLIDAGIDDLGGISPITIDHVNPERPWPQIDAIAAVLEPLGFNLAPRLTAHPEYVTDPDRWFDPDLHFPIMDRSDTEGMGRDDPGAVLPERTMEDAKVTDGAEVMLIGDRSTSWFSGADTAPVTLLPAHGWARGRIGELLDAARCGEELGVDEITDLFSARGSEVAAVANLADELREQVNGDVVTYVNNRNINYTNVCTFKCQFCGFSKGPLSLNLRGAPYLLTLDDIAERVAEAAEIGATEVCLQGGIHPDFDGNYYVDVIDAVHQAVPEMHIHGFTALEVTEGARRLGESLESYLARLRDAGLKSLPGTAAEILDDEVRAILCPDKVNTEEWLEAHRLAHRVGLSSNVTIMFGSVERPVHWARHLVRTRDLQKETGGFTEFVTLPFVHMASPIYLRRRSRRGPTFRETLLMHSVARIAYHGWIDNIQASWPKIGLGGVTQLLHAGVNDLGGTLMDENISRAAGATHGTELGPEDFAAAIEPLGRTLRQRNTRYDLIDGLVPACTDTGPTTGRQYALIVNKLPRYRTGNATLDQDVAQLIDDANLRGDEDLVFETVVSALRLGLEDVSRADLKLVNAALKELRYSFHVFAPYRDIPKCTIFGSARIKSGDLAYESAKELGAAMAAREWMVMTGAGPGIMAAGLEGAGRENSFGINIVLPFEASANEVILDDPKLINFRYFFTRKVTFMKESHGFAILPGGFGTMDEAFELLTLMQTGKSVIVPVVLLDPVGSTYWERWRQFVVTELLEDGLISAADMKLFMITNSVDEAAEELARFYRTFHSYRSVGQRLVLRLKREVSDAELDALNHEFGDIIEDGRIERIDATGSEIRDDDHVHLHRIAFRFDRHGHARLRVMIDALNDGVDAPAVP